MRGITLVACLLLPLSAAEDVREIIKRSVSQENGGWIRARDYNFKQRIEERKLDGSNKVKEVESRTFDVSILYGRPYSRLTHRNDKPLSAQDSQKEQEKLNKALADRQKEAAAGRSPDDKDLNNQRKLMRELPEAYQFKLVGEEQISGRGVYVIEATPRKEYQPKTTQAKILPKMKGKLWIDKLDYQWVKAEVDVIDTISFGLFLARLAPGAHLQMQQVRVNNEIWLPDFARVRFDARLALLKHLNEEVEITFRDYKKFQTDVKVVETGSAQ